MCTQSKSRQIYATHSADPSIEVERAALLFLGHAVGFGSPFPSAI